MNPDLSRPRPALESCAVTSLTGREHMWENVEHLPLSSHLAATACEALFALRQRVYCGVRFTGRFKVVTREQWSRAHSLKKMGLKRRQPRPALVYPVWW